MIAMAHANVALSAAWTIDASLLNKANMERLRSRYPAINDPNDLQNLLRDIGRLGSLSSLEAVWENGGWTIVGQSAPLISDISFKLTTRLLRTKLETLTQPYITQVDSDELRRKLVAEVKELYARHGFPQAQVTVTAKDVSAGRDLRVTVDEGFPCLISDVQVDFRLPRSANVKVKVGEICDLEVANEAVQSLEEQLIKLGYNQLRIDKPNFIYSAPTNSAVLNISGKLNQRLKYEIIDTEKRFFLADLFSNDELKAIDPTIVGPDAMGAELARRYRNFGFDDVAVQNPETRTEDQDMQVYTYRVTPGPQYIISSIDFEGATVFTQSELLDSLGLTGFWQTSTPLNLDELRNGITRIKNRYNKVGYWDAIVRDPRLTKNRENASVQIVISITEGPMRTLSGVTVSGNNSITSEEIRKLLPIDNGAPFDRADLVDFEQRLRELYVNRGYLYATSQIELLVESLPRRMPTTVNVVVREGPRVKIGEITISGLIHTQAKVVNRELTFAPGDWYSPAELEQSQRNLINLGLFRTVQILPSDRNAVSEQFEYLDITVDVREAKPGTVSFGPGWSLAEGSRFAVESTYNNIGGAGRQVFGRVSVSEESDQKAIGDKTLVGRTFSLGYLEPYVLNLPLNGTISLNHTARAAKFWTLTRGGEVALTHKFRKWVHNGTLTGFYGQKVVQEVGEGQLLEAFLSEDLRVGAMGLRFTQDFRDDLTWPTHGFIINSELSWARFEFGGDVKYFFWEFIGTRYIEVMRDTVLAMGISLAAYQGVDRRGSVEDILPYSERLQAGGADTVRGYKERALGPYALFDNDEIVDSEFGGSHRGVFKFELRHQIIRDTLALATFIDSGNVFFTQGELYHFETFQGGEIVDNQPYDFLDLLRDPKVIWEKNYQSYGLSLNYLTPLGSVNLAYGLPWDRCPDHKKNCRVARGKTSSSWYANGEFHINVGAVF